MKTDLSDTKLLVLGRCLAEGRRGRHLRESAGLSLREAADLLGVDVSCLSRWERGLDRPSQTTAIRWARLCTEIEEALKTTLQSRTS